MTTKKKLFIVDTNVMIYDPRAIVRLGYDNDILIPMGVIEELDKHKKGNDERGVASRSVVRLIDSIIREGRERGQTLDKGITIDPTHGSGKLIIRLNNDYNQYDDFIEDSYVDNIILQIAKIITARDCGTVYSEVAVITKDIALRIKGEAMGLDMQDYENSLIRSEEYYTESALDLEVSDQVLADLYSGNEVSLEDIGYTDDLPVNTYVSVRSSNTDFITNYDPTLCKMSHGGLRCIKERQKPLYGVIRARNREQAFLIDALMNDSIDLVAVPGPAGSGKTLLSMAAALEQTLNSKKYKKIVIMRPMVSVGAGIGYLPGSLEEKIQPWMAPIYDAVEVLHPNLGRDALSNIQIFKVIEFQAISLIRGRSLSDAFIIVDEAQNLSSHEIKTIITRAGENSKIVLTGDVFQIDSPYLDERSNGLSHVISKMDGEEIFAYVNMIHSERSDLAEAAAKLL